MKEVYCSQTNWKRFARTISSCKMKAIWIWSECCAVTLGLLTVEFLLGVIYTESLRLQSDFSFILV